MSKMGQTIEGLSEQICTNEQQVLQLVRMAKGNRVVCEWHAARCACALVAHVQSIRRWCQAAGKGMTCCAAMQLSCGTCHCLRHHHPPIHCTHPGKTGRKQGMRRTPSAHSQPPHSHPPTHPHTHPRPAGETKANARSSRSHLIVRIKLEAVETLPGGTTKALASLLNLVDLAGSERVDKAGTSETSTRFKEATHINKGLLVLGTVVTALADAADGRKAHIPYRDSKLTRMLQDSLGGSARTALIACITPLPDWHLEQSKHTLDFAARAGRVVCTPQANVVALPASDASAEMELLQAEVGGRAGAVWGVRMLALRWLAQAGHGCAAGSVGLGLSAGAASCLTWR
jgi:hypothetical protein